MSKKNKKLASEFAIGVVLLMALLFAGIFWLQGKVASLEEQQASEKVVYSRTTDSAKEKISDKQDTQRVEEKNRGCVPRYFDGEASVNCWKTEAPQEDGGIVVQISSEDAKKLPLLSPDSASTDLAVKVIDPTDEIKDSLKSATKENPVQISVHGYAEVCKAMPEVSIGPALVAFKKG